MKIKKYVVCFFVFTLLLIVNINAYDPSAIDEQVNIESLLESIPEEFKEYLPEDLTESGNAVEIAQNTEQNFLLSFVLNVLKKLISPTAKTFCSLLGVIAVTSIVNTAKNSIASPTFSKCITYITLLGTAIVTYDLLSSLQKTVEMFMASLNTLINALLPVMTLLYTMGGNVSTAVVNSSGISFIITLLNGIYQYGLFPLLKTCFGLSLAGIIGGFNGMPKITKTIKNTFTVILSGSMTLLSIFLLFKANISASADGTMARTVKFAGSFIPVVGSALGESVRTIMASVSLIKNSVGFVGIVIILIITLPTLLNILMNKIAVDLSAGIASLLGCDKESMLYEEYSSILAFSFAVTLCVSILFIFELTVFVTVSPALGAS